MALKFFRKAFEAHVPESMVRRLHILGTRAFEVVRSEHGAGVPIHDIKDAAQHSLPLLLEVSIFADGHRLGGSRLDGGSDTLGDSSSDSSSDRRLNDASDFTYESSPQETPSTTL